MRIDGLGALLAAIMGTWALLLACQCGHAATVGEARPAELPPQDFAAAQYIDSAGCVFVRQGDGWIARQARDGTPVCGYPPTLSARRTAPDRLAPLFAAAAEDEGTRIRRELTETVMAGLHTGELAGEDFGAPAAGIQDQRPAVQDAAPAASAPLATPGLDTSASLPGMIAAVPRLRAGIAGASAGDHTAQLCRLLGGRSGANAGLGAQDTLGMCGGMEPLTLHARTVAALPSAGRAAAATSGSRAAGRDAASSHRPSKTAPRGGGAPKDATTRRAGKTDRGADPFSATPLIPAGARFVQVGLFKDPGDAARAARKLSAMGLPVSRGQSTGPGGPLQAIMAGPFDSRQGIVRALDRVRRGGFPSAYPR